MRQDVEGQVTKVMQGIYQSRLLYVFIQSSEG